MALPPRKNGMVVAFVFTLACSFMYCWFAVSSSSTSSGSAPFSVDASSCFRRDSHQTVASSMLQTGFAKSSIAKDAASPLQSKVAMHEALSETPNDKVEAVAQPFAFPVDFVYCWSGEASQRDDGVMKTGDSEGIKDHNQGLGFGELRYSILFLEAYAPWFNKVYILVNTPAERPTWLTEASKDKIVMIDRCSLFSRPQDCPTQNDAACRAVMHKIPDLSEHFVALDDDMLVIKPSSPSDFFTSQGTPLVLIEFADTEDVPIYGSEPPGPDKPPKKQPTRMQYFIHVPYPNLVSFAWEFENTYPDWFAFVRSHRIRFTCCDASTIGDGYDELFHRIYPHMLLKMKVGIHRPSRWAQCAVSTGSGAACIAGQLTDPNLMFLNMNNIFEEDDWREVHGALENHTRTGQLTGPSLMSLEMNNIYQQDSWREVHEALESHTRGKPASKFVNFELPADH